SKAAELEGRLSQLQREAKEADDRLRRLYRMMEEGELDFDEMLKARVTDLRSTHENTHAALARAISQRSSVPDGWLVDQSRMSRSAGGFTRSNSSLSEIYNAVGLPSRPQLLIASQADPAKNEFRGKHDDRRKCHQ
ncbi:hypothetical protein ACCT09_37840, partial [Rhizobium ruizarguesonis]